MKRSKTQVENPQMIQEKSSHTQRVIVSCYRSLLFENEERLTEIVNGERCRNMLNAFLAPVVEQMSNRNELWFQ